MTDDLEECALEAALKAIHEDMGSRHVGRPNLEAALAAYKAVKQQASDVQTHAVGCWAWGHRHYECAVGRIEALEADNARMSRIEDAVRSVPSYAWHRSTFDELLAVLENSPRPDTAP